MDFVRYIERRMDNTDKDRKKKGDGNRSSYYLVSVLCFVCFCFCFRVFFSCLDLRYCTQKVNSNIQVHQIFV